VCQGALSRAEGRSANNMTKQQTYNDKSEPKLNMMPKVPRLWKKYDA